MVGVNACRHLAEIVCHKSGIRVFGLKSEAYEKRVKRMSEAEERKERSKEKSDMR